MITIEVNQQSGKNIAAAVWRRWAKKIARELKISQAGISVAVVGNAAMKRLNAQYRGKDRVTDVLSFGRETRTGAPDFAPPGYLGEIIICLPRAAMQARAAGHSLNAEVELLTVHGILHLLGYDHEKSAREAKKMRLLEEKITKSK